MDLESYSEERKLFIHMLLDAKNPNQTRADIILHGYFVCFAIVTDIVANQFNVYAQRPFFYIKYI